MEAHPPNPWDGTATPEKSGLMEFGNFSTYLLNDPWHAKKPRLGPGDPRGQIYSSAAGVRRQKPTLTAVEGVVQNGPECMDLLNEPRVLSQNTSMMCFCKPRTIQVVPRIPISPNKISKYLFKPEIHPDRYLHRYLAHLVVSPGPVILGPKRTKMTKTQHFQKHYVSWGVLKMFPFRC